MGTEMESEEPFDLLQLGDFDDQLIHEMGSHNFSESERITLCKKLPCKVAMHHRNIYWKYEQYVINLLKAKGTKITEKHYKYVYNKFKRKLKQHYEKQLKSESDYRAIWSNVLLHHKVDATLFLESIDTTNIVVHSEISDSSTPIFEYSLSPDPAIHDAVGTNNGVNLKSQQKSKTQIRASQDNETENTEFFTEASFFHSGVDIGSEVEIQTQETAGTNEITYSAFNKDINLQGTEITSTQDVLGDRNIQYAA